MLINYYYYLITRQERDGQEPKCPLDNIVLNRDKVSGSYLKKKNPIDEVRNNIYISGDVVLNCLSQGSIRKPSPFELGVVFLYQGNFRPGASFLRQVSLLWLCIRLHDTNMQKM